MFNLFYEQFRHNEQECHIAMTTIANATDLPDVAEIYLLRQQVAALQADYDAEVYGRAQDYQDGIHERLAARDYAHAMEERAAAAEQYNKELVRMLRTVIRKGKNMVMGAGASTPHGERRELHWAIEAAEALLKVGE